MFTMFCCKQNMDLWNLQTTAFYLYLNSHNFPVFLVLVCMSWESQPSNKSTNMNMIALFYHDSHVPTFAKTGTRFALCKFFHVDWSNGFYFCITCGHKMSVSLNKDNCHKMKKTETTPWVCGRGHGTSSGCSPFHPSPAASRWLGGSPAEGRTTHSHTLRLHAELWKTHTHTRQQWKKQWNPFHFWNELQQKTVSMQIYGKHHEQREWHHPCWGAFAVWPIF